MQNPNTLYYLLSGKTGAGLLVLTLMNCTERALANSTDDEVLHALAVTHAPDDQALQNKDMATMLHECTHINKRLMIQNN